MYRRTEKEERRCQYAKWESDVNGGEKKRPLGAFLLNRNINTLRLHRLFNLSSIKVCASVSVCVHLQSFLTE